MSTSPQQPPPIPRPQPQAPPPLAYQTPQAGTHLSGRETYNVVSDTVTGVNIRLLDNLVQLVVVLIGAGAGVLVGHLLHEGDRPATAMILGAIGGLVAGVILSGTFLAIYRGVRHLKGKHD